MQVLKLDNQFLVATIDHNLLTIPLTKAMEPGDTRRLDLDTRRVFPPNAPKTFVFSGLPLFNAAEQTGAIAIGQAANLWINVTATQGLRRIDPRELPTDLRSHPGTGMAYQFGDQPCKLGLTPGELFSVVSLGSEHPHHARDRDGAGGHNAPDPACARPALRAIEILIPPVLQLISVGPDELVESAIPVQAPSSDRLQQSAQVLRIHLTEPGRDLKSFSLRLRGQQRTAPEGDSQARPLRQSRWSLDVKHHFSVRQPRVELRARQPVKFSKSTRNRPAFNLSPVARHPRLEPASASPERLPIAVFRSHQNPPGCAAD